MKNKNLLIYFLFTFLLSCTSQSDDKDNLEEFPLSIEEKTKIDSLINEYRDKFSIENTVSFKKYSRIINILSKDSTRHESFVIIKMNNKGDIIGNESKIKAMTQKIADVLYNRLKDSTQYVGVISQIKIQSDGVFLKREGTMKVGIEFDHSKDF